MRKIFVTGIGTGIGKTLVAAILTEKLKADYWKPVQAGNLENTDTDIVKNLVSNNVSVFHPETFRLTKPMSPHAAAEMDGTEIKIENFNLPETRNDLIIEGAGGLLVPLSQNLLVIDLIKHFNAEVVLVSQNYLGSINHTLLSAEALKARSIKVLGIVFNGDENRFSEDFILRYTGLNCIGRIDKEHELTKTIVKKYASQLSW